MRLFLISLAFFIAFSISCILDPYVVRDETGVCYSGKKEYENLIASQNPQITITSGLPDTIVIDSIDQSFPFKYSCAIDSNYFSSGRYEISIHASYITDISSESGFYYNNVFFYISDSISKPNALLRSGDTLNANLTLHIDTSSGYFPSVMDTGKGALNFTLGRFVDNTYCCSSALCSRNLYIVVRFQNARQ